MLLQVKRKFKDEGGSIILPIICAVSVMSILINCLWLMGNQMNKIADKASAVNRLRIVGEECLEQEIKILQTDDQVVKSILQKNGDVFLQEFNSREINCQIYGIHKGDNIILMGAVSNDNEKNRLYVRLEKRNDQYTPVYWEY